MATVYKLDKVTLPKVVDEGYILKLAEWVTDSIRQVEAAQTDRRTSTIVIPLRRQANGVGVFEDATYTAAYANATWTFELTKDHFKVAGMELANVRMRALDVQVHVDMSTGIKAELFDFALTIPSNVMRDKGTTIYAPKNVVLRPSSTYSAGKPSVEPSRDIHNLDPIGTWTVKTTPNAYYGGAINADAVSRNILLVMTVTYDALTS